MQFLKWVGAALLWLHQYSRQEQTLILQASTDGPGQSELEPKQSLKPVVGLQQSYHNGQQHQSSDGHGQEASLLC